MRLSWMEAAVLSVVIMAINALVIIALPSRWVDVFMFGVGVIAFGSIVGLTVARTRHWDPDTTAMTLMFAALTLYFLYLGVTKGADWRPPDGTNLLVRTLVTTSAVMAVVLFPWKLDENGETK